VLLESQGELESDEEACLAAFISLTDPFWIKHQLPEVEGLSDGRSTQLVFQKVLLVVHSLLRIDLPTRNRCYYLFTDLLRSVPGNAETNVVGDVMLLAHDKRAASAAHQVPLVLNNLRFGTIVPEVGRVDGLAERVNPPIVHLSFR